MLTRMRGLKVLVLLVVATVALAAVAACNGGGENGEPSGTPGTPGPETTLPPSTDAPTLEARPTLTPGAYESPPGSANLFGNPGFEEGEKYWFGLHEQTVQTGEVAHSGTSGAYLKMRDAADVTGAQVYYLVQEVDPAEFPELISGYYRVDNWKRGTEKQYLQFVVILFAPTNLNLDKQGTPLATPYPNYQTRYILSGITEEPFRIDNSFFKFLSSDVEPRQGEWVYFESNIKQDFEQWGAVPAGYSKMRFLFEVRFDDKEAGAPAEADVYYDDLYLGPADANPNKP